MPGSGVGAARGPLELLTDSDLYLTPVKRALASLVDSGWEAGQKEAALARGFTTRRRANSHCAKFLVRLCPLLSSSSTTRPRVTRGPRPDASRLADSLRDRPQAPTPLRLTSRERQIARLVARGYSDKVIAHALTISENTVRTHLSRLYAREGVAGRVDLTRRWFSTPGAGLRRERKSSR